MRTFSKTILLWIALSIPTRLWAEEVISVTREVVGKVEYLLPDSSEYGELKPGQQLPTGSKVRTGPKSTALITVTPGVAMNVAENTSVILTGMEFDQEGEKVKKRRANIKLSEGTISTLIDRSTPEATDFKVTTPQGTVAARGTYYGVTVKDGETFVQCEEGKVGVSSDDSVAHK